MTKEQVIEKEYRRRIDESGLYELIKNHITADGWLRGDVTDNDHSRAYNILFDGCERRGDDIRPIALKGIEDNNGWFTIIKEDKCTLPKESGQYWVIYYKTYGFSKAYYTVEKGWDTFLPVVQWQPIISPKLPHNS